MLLLVYPMKNIAMEPIIMHYTHLLTHFKVTTGALNLDLVTVNGLLGFTFLVEFWCYI